MSAATPPAPQDMSADATTAAKNIPPLSAPATSASNQRISAADRLALSRTQLRSAMMNIAHPPKRASIVGESFAPFAKQWLHRMQSLPGAAIVIDSLQSWWRRHPLRTAGLVAEEASRKLVRPIAQRHPQTLIWSAAAVGASLVLIRPWRWILRPALLIGLLPQLMSQLLKHMPVESWLQMAVRLLARSPVSRESKAGSVARATKHPASRLP